MNSLRLLLACTITAMANAQDLTLAELASRPEFLPNQCSLTKPVMVERHVLSPGQKLTVKSLRGKNVELWTPDGGNTFETKADVTDVLAVAQETWKKLTPEQRSLTYAQLLQSKELWPYRVTVNVKLSPLAMPYADGIDVGDSLVLKGVEGSQILVVSEKMKMTFPLEPRDTDILDSARKLVENPDAFPGRITEDLAGNLINPGTGAAAPLEGKAEPRY